MSQNSDEHIHYCSNNLKPQQSFLSILKKEASDLRVDTITPRPTENDDMVDIYEYEKQRLEHIRL